MSQERRRPRHLSGSLSDAATHEQETGGQARYFSVAVVKHFHAKDAEFFTDYFAPRCAHYFLFTFGMNKRLASSNSIQFSQYLKGQLVRNHVLVRDQSGHFFPRYAQLVFWFVFFALFHLPRGTWVLALHPPACVLQSVVRLLKRHQYALILSDLLNYDVATISGRFMNWLLYKEIRAVECLMYPSPMLEQHYEPRLGPKREDRLCIRKRWSVGLKKRFTRETLDARGRAVEEHQPIVIGYIGLVRPFCGLGKLAEYMEHHEEVRLDVIGEAHVDELREECRRHGVEGRVTFYGFRPINEVADIAARWFCGAMLFDVTGDVYARYGEPGKAKAYLSFGLPVLMTDVSCLVDEIRKFHAGVVLPTNDVVQIEAGMNELRRDYAGYVRGAIAMAEFYDCERRYDKDFEFMRSVGEEVDHE